MTIYHRILITGGTKRIGAAIARRLAALPNVELILHYNKASNDAQALAQELQNVSHIKVNIIQCDLVDAAAVSGLIAKAARQFGPITILINNAAVFEPQQDNPATLTKELWDKHLTINTWAPLRLALDFAKQLPDDITGNIVNILDQRVVNISGAFLSYTVSKAALATLTQSLAIALAPRIRVNGVAPGMTLPAPNQDLTHFHERQAATPLGTGGDPAEIANTVAFLIDNKTITGQIIAVDGGEHLVKKAKV